MRYVLIGVAVLAGLVLSAALVMRSFQTMPAPEPERTAAAPAETAPPPAAEARPPAAAEPQPARAELPVAAQLPLVHAPETARPGPSLAAVPPAQSEKPELAPGVRLRLTEEQRGRLRDVLLAHNVMQTEAPAAALKVGGTVPESVVLSPLPIEIADAVPAYSRYSYVIAEDRIAIVRNERREIEALIPF